jgi:hypothetical protein
MPAMRGDRFARLAHHFDLSQRFMLMAVAISLCLKLLADRPLDSICLGAGALLFFRAENRFLLSFSRLSRSGPDFAGLADIASHLILPPIAAVAGLLAWLARPPANCALCCCLSSLAFTFFLFLGGSLLKSYALFFRCADAKSARRGFFSLVQRAAPPFSPRGSATSARSRAPRSASTAPRGSRSPCSRCGAVHNPPECRRAGAADLCAICRGTAADPCQLPCGHAFCEADIERCPVCRAATPQPADVGIADGTTDWIHCLCAF